MGVQADDKKVKKREFIALISPHPGNIILQGEPQTLQRTGPFLRISHGDARLAGRSDNVISKGWRQLGL